MRLEDNNPAVRGRLLEGTQVIYNETEIIEAIKHFQAGTKKFWGACVDSTLPSFSMGKVKQGYIDAKNRGVRIMYITEITKENREACKEIMRFAEMRHLDNIVGNFAISETEYVAGNMIGKKMVSLVKSDLKELVSQQRGIFEMLWGYARPAEERMKLIIP